MKYIAILAMVSDHVAHLFVSESNPLYFMMRLTGRLTIPIMCFFIAEGFYYTSSKYKYGLRLGVFALISQPFFTLFHYGTLFTYSFFTNLNVIYTLAIGFCVLLAYEKIANKIVMWGTIGLLCAASLIGDWNLIVPPLVLLFYIFRDNKRKMIFFFCVVTATAVLTGFFVSIHYVSIQMGLFLVIPLLLFYNGRKGNANAFHKWVFYLFYPLHLFAISIIKLRY